MIPSRSLSHMSRRLRGRCSASQIHQGKAVRQAMLEYIATCESPPSYREIGEAVGLSSSSTIWSHVRKLREEGLIAPAEPGRPRAITLANHGPSELETLRARVAELEACAWRVVDLLRGGTIWRCQSSLTVLERCLPEVRP